VWTASIGTGLFAAQDGNNQFRADYQLCWWPQKEGEAVALPQLTPPARALNALIAWLPSATINVYNTTLYHAWVVTSLVVAVVVLLYARVKLTAVRATNWLPQPTASYACLCVCVLAGVRACGLQTSFKDTLAKRKETLEQSAIYTAVITLYWIAVGQLRAFPLAAHTHGRALCRPAPSGRALSPRIRRRGPRCKTASSPLRSPSSRAESAWPTRRSGSLGWRVMAPARHRHRRAVECRLYIQRNVLASKILPWPIKLWCGRRANERARACCVAVRSPRRPSGVGAPSRGQPRSSSKSPTQTRRRSSTTSGALSGASRTTHARLRVQRRAPLRIRGANPLWNHPLLHALEPLAADYAVLARQRRPQQPVRATGSRSALNRL
jgi:hypothetical protein